ncbi:MAG: hypothetical protein WCF65_07845, partial [Parachlamydiaceae bacterium]
MIEKNDTMRHLIEMAIHYGRKRKSPQTGYLHYCYGLPEQEPHLPIPLLENFLYALALLRSRLVENVHEAKTLLEGLLHFQDKAEGITQGNFPIYLHEFPLCKDRFKGIHVASVIVWILKLFHQILGSELRQRLQQALLLAVQHAMRAHDEKAPPYVVSVKIASVAIAAGRILNLPLMEAHGNAMLDRLCLSRDPSTWYCPESLGELLTALVMVYPRLSESPWSPLWKHVEETWNPQMACYVGPALREWQDGKEPQTTVYDLFLGYVSGSFSSRMSKEAPVHLEAVLIPPMDDRFQPVTFPALFTGKFQGAAWHLYQDEGFAYSYIDQGSLEINTIHATG